MGRGASQVGRDKIWIIFKALMGHRVGHKDQAGLPCWVEQSPLGVLRKQSPLGLLLSWTSLAKMVHLFGLPSRKISGRAKTLELTVMLGLDN